MWGAESGLGGSNSPRIRPGAVRMRPREESQRQRDDPSRTAGHTQDRARRPCLGPRPGSPVPGPSPGPLPQGGGTQVLRPQVLPWGPGSRASSPLARGSARGRDARSREWRGRAKSKDIFGGQCWHLPGRWGNVHMRKSWFPCEVEFLLKTWPSPFSLSGFSSLTLSLSGLMFQVFGLLVFRQW